MQYQTNYPYATTSQQYGAISNRRDEQRRRQQEYSQALAKQVAQREQQKRREREMDQQYRRHSGAFPNPFNQNFRQEAFASAASSHRYSQLPPALSSFSPSKASHKWRLESMGTTDSNDDLDESLDGDQLEALFQRNVRRHEILLGFQSKLQGQPQDAKQRKPDAKLAWAELHQQLESNRRALMLRKLSTMSTASNDSNQETIDNEAALVASSKWVPSTVLSTRRRNVVNN
ncbi:ABC transporter G family member 29 [Phytophthora nicotianae]|uniref:ABC transporter G family member 29 n=1 Tax=Phytophthora nicotianae TaxID=4792 RepID=A0A0W8DDM3_PHYNI|nr:ABC transporter G family member 29 [Phytophthora nicotianae]